MAKLTRRSFLIGGAVTGGVLAGATLLGVGYLSTLDVDGLTPTLGDDGEIHLNAWLAFGKDGSVTFAIPRAEMGQGITTSLPMLIAEELGLPLTGAVTVVHPYALLPAYTNWALGLQKRNETMSGAVDWVGKRSVALLPFIGTGGSTSVMDAYYPLRRAGAAARELFKQAAAKKWQTTPDGLFAKGGAITDPATGLSLPFAALAEKAMQEKPPTDLRLKPKSEWTLLGTPMARLDIPAKVQGKANFGIDAEMNDADLLFAAIRHAPVFGATVKTISRNGADTIKGVKDIVTLDAAVAVVADNSWTAQKALDQIEVDYSLPEGPLLSSESVEQTLRTALSEGERHVHLDKGDVDAALTGEQLVEAEYATPFLAHATLEPMNATARVTKELVEVWSPNQSPTLARFAASEAPAGTEDTRIHTTLSGGGFGRRVEKDFTSDAVQVAARFPGRTVKVTWSRAEDIQHDVYRPAASARMRGKIDKSGRLTGFDFIAASQSVSAGFSSRNLPMAQDGTKDPAIIEGALHLPYATANRRISAVEVGFPVPVGYWRSVGHSNNAFFIEGFMDELAAAAGQDPFDLRQNLLADHPRFAPLAQKLRALSGWDTPSAAGRYRGVSIHESFRSFVGQVAEVFVDADGGVMVEKVTCVADVGTVINPDTVKAQMESGIIFGLSAALYGDITIEDGRVTQSNYYDYDMVRMGNAPLIEVALMENDHAPGGAGEPGTPPIFAAVTNALFKASGSPLRQLPISKAGFYAL